MPSPKRDMRIIVDGVEWPRFSTFREITTPNESSDVTLDGTMYTDYIGNPLRSWAVGWDKIVEEDWQKIYQSFRNQQRFEAYPVIEVPAYGISVQMKIDITGDPQIRLNGQIRQSASVTLREKYAITD